VLGCGEEAAETGEKTITLLSISPSSASLKVGQSVTFSCTANYSDGSSASVKPTWTLSGAIGAITTIGYNCSFSASQEGFGSVNAAYGGLSASAAITVSVEVAPGLATIEVSPAAYTGRVSGSVVFSAAGKTASAETMTIVPVWALSGDPVGVLSASGTTATLEITAEGHATIACTSGEVVGYAYVTIEGFVVEITVEADTYVDEADPGATHGSDFSLMAGYVSLTGKHYETYLRFPLTLIPAGASIEAAVLRLYPSSAGSATLQLKRLDSAFSNATTWATKPTVGIFLLAGTFSPLVYNELGGDPLLTLVREWFAGTRDNRGVAIVQEITTDGTVVILSLENGSNFPLLRIEYTTP
jgi:hypothetical protein